MQVTPADIAETMAMVAEQHLDIRTITLSMNLRGCGARDVDKAATRVYDRMTSVAENLVPTVEQLEREFGIPIVNKRISVTPVAEICAAVTQNDLSPIAQAMDRAAKEVVSQLKKAGCNVLGVVLNNAGSKRKNKYYYSNRRYQYKSYQNETPSK